MGQHDDILAAVLRIHEAGVDATKWPEALRAATSLLGGSGGSLEYTVPQSRIPCGFVSFGLDDGVAPYLAHYASMNPRLRVLDRQPGELIWERQFIEDAAIARDPFYMEFLADLDLRYCLGGLVGRFPDQLVATSIQFSLRQGHPTAERIDLLAALMPHMQQAVDVNHRLGALTSLHNGFRHALDWLTDGVFMLARDGTVRFANAAAQAMLRRSGGLDLRNGALTFRSTEAATKFRKALDALRRLPGLDVTAIAHADFTIERESEMPPLVVSLRPLSPEGDAWEGAAALMFVHDPLARGGTKASLLRDAFGLTLAEADVAAALCAGLSADDYARARRLSRNTVYTHLRHIKEKIGCTRMAELIRRLNDAKEPAVKRKV